MEQELHAVAEQRKGSLRNLSAQADGG